MMFMEEADRTEICRHFGLTEPNLRVVIHRARVRLQQKVGRIPDEDCAGPHDARSLDKDGHVTFSRAPQDRRPPVLCTRSRIRRAAIVYQANESSAGLAGFHGLSCIFV